MNDRSHADRPVAPAGGSAGTGLRRLAEGDPSESAFEAALPELARLIRGYLTASRVPRPHLEDLAQDAIIRVYVRRGDRRGRDVASLKAWIRVICRNLAISAASRREWTVEAPVAEDPVPDRDLREALEMGIERLREPDRTVFRLRFEQDWSTREIAEFHGWKMRNCEYVIARARESLAGWLRREGYGFGAGRSERTG